MGYGSKQPGTHTGPDFVGEGRGVRGRYRSSAGARSAARMVRDRKHCCQTPGGAAGVVAPGPLGRTPRPPLSPTPPPRGRGTASSLPPPSPRVVGPEARLGQTGLAVTSRGRGTKFRQTGPGGGQRLEEGSTTWGRREPERQRARQGLSPPPLLLKVMIGVLGLGGGTAKVGFLARLAVGHL